MHGDVTISMHRSHGSDAWYVRDRARACRAALPSALIFIPIGTPDDALTEWETISVYLGPFYVTPPYCCPWPTGGRSARIAWASFEAGRILRNHLSVVR